MLHVPEALCMRVVYPAISRFHHCIVAQMCGLAYFDHRALSISASQCQTMMWESICHTFCCSLLVPHCICCLQCVWQAQCCGAGLTILLPCCPQTITVKMYSTCVPISFWVQQGVAGPKFLFPRRQAQPVHPDNI